MGPVLDALHLLLEPQGVLAAVAASLGTWAGTRRSPGGSGGPGIGVKVIGPVTVEAWLIRRGSMRLPGRRGDG
jgi:hypothetical protein